MAPGAGPHLQHLPARVFLDDLSDIPALTYQRHLFQERTLRSVTANTRRDGTEFLRLAAQIGLRVTVSRYPMAAADRALADLAADRVHGAAVLVNR